MSKDPIVKLLHDYVPDKHTHGKFVQYTFDKITYSKGAFLILCV